ncbi:MAG: flagellin [Bacteriovoracaceae bacterium]
MGFRINTNVQSLRAQSSLNQIRKTQDKALAEMSSGSRINRAGDDAAGLAISEKLKAQISSSHQAKRNASDGVSVVQTAEGGLNEISSILIRLRELSIQSANDTVGNAERKFSDMEFQNLREELDRIANTTEFNGVKLLNGEGEKMNFQIGLHGDANSRLTFESGENSVTAEDLKVESMNVLTKEDSQSNLAGIDGAIEKINSTRANLGALQNRMQSTMRNIDVQTENLSAANSRVRDTDIAKSSSELVRANILAQANTAVLSQANNTPQTALRLIG